MSQLAVLPILIPLLTGVLLIFIPSLRLQRVLSTASVFGVLVLTIVLFINVWQDGIVVYKYGDWLPPFGITLVADLWSSGLLCIAMMVALASLTYSIASLDALRERSFFHSLFQFLLVGVNGVFLTGDIFNLFVFFEVMLISSYGLVALGGTAGQLEATVKYVTINLIGSTLLVGVIGLLYGVVGTLNMADIAQKVDAVGSNSVITLLSLVFLIVFGLKAAVFGLWFWMPGTYTVVPAGLSAYLGGMLTKIGVYGILRVFTLIFVQDVSFTHNIILILACLTMFFGVLGAAAQHEYRTILTWHISSQVGYMIMGVGLYSVAGIAGTVFYVMNNILVKASLFLSSGIAERLTRTLDIYSMGGLLKKSPFAAFLFLVAALALAGVPPFSGFWGKLLLVKAGLESGGLLDWIAVATALVTSFFTLYSMMKIWQNAYWRTPQVVEGLPVKLLFPPTILLVAVTLVMGLWPALLYDYAYVTAQQLMDPWQYIDAVRQAGLSAFTGGAG